MGQSVDLDIDLVRLNERWHSLRPDLASIAIDCAAGQSFVQPETQIKCPAVNQPCEITFRVSYTTTLYWYHSTWRRFSLSTAVGATNSTMALH